ncbi:hypothetical protein [Bordetella avium]|uniref:hypothetical protein n=1 Tax=Bordetella avium TaxID=521 RepID=UPI0002D6D224|nr:hypothetical protein [Bordetella avium]WQE32319.1 hypothetical protein U0029_10325 [Bordetella avium]SUV69195.1 Uncharacterised protein [Bordetella avium]
MRALNNQQVKAKLNSLEDTVVANSPNEFKAVIAGDVAQWKHAAQEAKIQLDQ